MNTRQKMCFNKCSFFTKKKAQEYADPHGQRIYECPICFCWHCTSKENWKLEYIDREYHEKEINKLENKLRHEANERLAEKNREINKLKLRVKRLKNGYDDEEQPIGTSDNGQF